MSKPSPPLELADEGISLRRAQVEADGVPRHAGLAARVQKLAQADGPPEIAARVILTGDII